MFQDQVAARNLTAQLTTPRKHHNSRLMFLGHSSAGLIMDQVTDSDLMLSPRTTRLGEGGKGLPTSPENGMDVQAPNQGAGQKRAKSLTPLPRGTGTKDKGLHVASQGPHALEQMQNGSQSPVVSEHCVS
uniref:Uncharacterized protein n=1 Tax=Eutreptiella gymnastica TaxID=73025 RepID=A0A7S4CWS6_9EUGL